MWSGACSLARNHTQKAGNIAMPRCLALVMLHTIALAGSHNLLKQLKRSLSLLLPLSNNPPPCSGAQLSFVWIRPRIKQEVEIKQEQGEGGV